MIPSKSTSINVSNSNSDSYSSYESDNSSPSRISQTSPPFEVKDFKYFNQKASGKSPDMPNSDEEDYETTSISDHSVEIDVNLPLKTANKSAIIKKPKEFPSRLVNTSKPTLPKNIPLYYLQKESIDSRFKSIQKQNNLNLTKQTGNKQQKMYDSESENSSPDNHQSGTATNRTLKNRPKSRAGKKDKPNLKEYESSSNQRMENDFLEIIPPVSSRPKTTRLPSGYRRQSALAKHEIDDEAQQPPIVSELNLQEDDDDEEEEGSTESEDKIMSPFRGPLPGEYDPEKFNYLDVSDEIKDLFLHIIRYAPLHINLDFKFKPFIPDYIPSVGDVDAFLKINAPEKLPAFASTKKIDLDQLGINILDEPTKNQSDPALLHLHLRATISSTKKTDESNLIIKKVSNVYKDAATIDKWIEDVSKLHLSQPSVKFSYAHSMPPLELLLQPWPPNFEMLLQKNGFPSPKLKCSLSEYIDLTCTMFDIPVYDKRIESLHLLFSLYMATHKTELCDNTELKNINEITDEYLSENFRDENAQTNRFTFRY